MRCATVQYSAVREEESSSPSLFDTDHLDCLPLSPYRMMLVISPSLSPVLSPLHLSSHLPSSLLFISLSFFSHLISSPIIFISPLTLSHSPSAQNLVWVEENSDSHHLSLYFTAAAEYLQESHSTYEGIFPNRKGVLQSVELKPGGSEILVTDFDKKEYVALMVKHCTEGRFGVQATAVREGILDILPESCLEMFSDR